jgi:TRAP-type C4-dicarboxylate transport system permease small subunit
LRRFVSMADMIAKILSALSACAAIAMTTFVVLASTMRYVVESPFDFTEELVGLLFTAMIFIGLPVCIFRNTNISVTIIPDLMPPKMRRAADIAAQLLLILFCIWFGYLSFDYMRSMIELGGRTTGSRLLLWPWTALMPISCMLTAAAAAIRIIIPVAPSDPAHEPTVGGQI